MQTWLLSGILLLLARPLLLVTAGSLRDAWRDRMTKRHQTQALSVYQALGRAEDARRIRCGLPSKKSPEGKPWTIEAGRKYGQAHFLHIDNGEYEASCVFCDTLWPEEKIVAERAPDYSEAQSFIDKLNWR